MISLSYRYGSDAAQYLTDWKRQHGLTDERAAAWCRLSVSAFKRQRAGLVKHCRQTVALAELYPIHNVAWLDVAEAALRAGRVLTAAETPKRAEKRADRHLIS
jgi:hypothetical protein